VKRALLDVHQLGAKHTGNETWARNVVLELERRDAGLHYALHHGAPLPVEVENVRLHIVSSSSARRLLVDLPRVTRELDPPVVVAQYTLPLVRRPGVVVVHDLSFEDPRAAAWLSRKEILRYRATIRASVRRASAVVVSSEHTRADMLRAYPVHARKVLVAPCALDEPLARALQTARPADPSAPPYVLVVGNLLPRKNVLVVARAVARLRAGGTDIALRLVGKLPDGPSPALRQLKELLGPGLTATGHVDDAQLAAEYAGATVVCYPSLYEGFGLPLLEAMAAGAPVIASRASSLPEVAGQAALLVDPTDDEAWAAAILSILTSDPLRRQLVEAGRMRVLDFSWAQTVDVLLQALDQAVSARQR
jgi:glycosyltransferase involved in cell wall biosynthesis